MIQKGIDSFVIDTSNFTIAQNSPIGKGGNAAVYLVKDKEEKEYAAKVSLDPFQSHIEEKNFIRELMILSKCSNPCTINLKGFALVPRFEDDKNRIISLPTVIMEKAVGGSIRTKLEPYQTNGKKGIIDENWTPTKRMISLAGTAFGMKYLHSKHIIHRDLKPENVLLNEELHPKITDFGLSKIQYDTKQSFNDKGTIYYMAPEMFSSENFTNAVDVYAFSILAYEIITLKHPYPNKNQFQIIKIVTTDGRPKLPDDINENLKDLITRCWNQHDTERPSFEDIFECLKKPEYFMSDVDPDEYNAYLDSLVDESDSLCLPPEVQSIVNKAREGDTQKMLEAANGFYDGQGNYPFNQDQALDFYRMFSLSISKNQNPTKELQEEAAISERVIEEPPLRIKEEPLSDESLIDELPSEIKNIISEIETHEELFDISNKFREGIPPFPQIFQLSSYYSRKAYEVLFNESHKVEVNHDDDEEEEEPEDENNDEIDLLPICTQALICKLPHINILIHGNSASSLPIYNALSSKQKLDPEKCENPKFECFRIRGKAIFIYHAKDCDNTTSEEVLQFIKKRNSNNADPSEKILMCFYCISPSANSDPNESHMIQSFSNFVYTTVFVTSIEDKKVVEKLKKKIKGKIFRREKMHNIQKLKKDMLIFDVKLSPTNSHSDLLQEFINIVPNLSIINDI